MAYVPPLNGGRINASATGNTAGALSVISSGTMVLAGGNNITLSQNANTLTISGIPAFSAGVSNLSNDSGNTGMLTNRLVLAGGNNITLSQSTNANGATVSISGGAGGGGGGIAIVTSNTTFSSGSLQLSNAGGALTIATTTGQQLNFSVPQTTSVVGSGIVSLSSNGASVTISAPAFSAGISSNSVVTNQLILAAGNNVTLSQATNATGATLSIGANGVLTTQSYNTPQFNGSTGNSTMPILWAGNSNGSGNITMGLTGSTVTASAAGASAGIAAFSDGAHSINSGTINIVTNGAITASLTGQSLSLSVPGTSSVVGAGIVNLSTAGAGVTVSAPAFSAGVSNIGNTQGNTGTISNQIVLSGGNNITLSQVTGAGGITVGISGGAGGGGGGGVALSASNSSWSTGTVDMVAAGGALTINYSTTTGSSQSINFSVPAVSSLSATGILSISTNGSTISVGAPAFSAGIASNSTVTNQVILNAGNNVSLSQSTNATGATITINASGAANGTISNWEPMMLQYATLSSNTNLYATNSVYVFKVVPQAYVNATQLMLLANISNATTSSSTNSAAFSLYAGIYTLNGSTLSLVTQSSGSQSYGWSNSTNATASYNGVKGLTLPMNFSASPGNYWMAFLQKSGSTGAGANFSLSNIAHTFNSINYFGLPGQQSSASLGLQEGEGVYSSTSGALPSAIPMSSIIQSTPRLIPYMAFKNMTF